ncbi:DUF3581 family protein [Parashewanella tropica]|uniref:DUF3581 family protein n=1 Tax=Parashewanella tropica TaxID=2547970 RepID=UPI00105A363B|nr:DUF3581 family protein [Parashewanella tropica]
MYLEPYFSKKQNIITVSAEQASVFAKKVAGDVNPIHDVDAKRFCVPGDLLFALVLEEYGLSSSMEFKFQGMVGDGVDLIFPSAQADVLEIKDTKDKTYLSAQSAGVICQDKAKIEAFVRTYVSFSGLNFTHALLPLMEKHQVMVNPARPLVMYESMSFELHSFDFDSVELELSEHELLIDGKRGNVTLHFEFYSHGKKIGTGKKTLVMSGLREYQEEAIAGMRELYESRKLKFA